MHDRNGPDSGYLVPGTRAPFPHFKSCTTEGDALERYLGPEPSASAIGDAKRKHLIDKATRGL
jgi:hypothetical protein